MSSRAVRGWVRAERSWGGASRGKANRRSIPHPSRRSCGQEPSSHVAHWRRRSRRLLLKWRRSASSTLPCSPWPHGCNLPTTTIRVSPSARASSCQTFAPVSELARSSKRSTGRPRRWPDVHPIHNHVPLGFAWHLLGGGDCCAAGLLQTLLCVLPVSGCDKR